MYAPAYLRDFLVLDILRTLVFIIQFRVSGIIVFG